MGLLGDQYRDLYAKYYTTGHGDLTVKRSLAAADSFRHIHSLLGNDNPDSIIDVGAGNGSVLDRIQHSTIGLRLAAVEISESGVAEIRARHLPKVVDVQLFNGYSISFPDKSFDLAISIHVLEHVEHERMFLRELQRVAKRIIVEVPLENGLRVARAIHLGRPNGHINYYTPATFLNLLETSGLTVLRHSVHASSLAYEQYVSGKFKGRVKSAIRRAVLAATPAFAPWAFNYLLTAYCESRVEDGAQL